MIYYDQNGIVVRTAIKSDVDYLKTRLRKSDIDEVWASDHFDPETALRISLEKSLWSATVQNGHPIAMFGINPEIILGDKAVVWFLATDDLKLIERRFLRNSKKFIKLMLGYYGVLYNYVKADHHEAIAWLTFLGAKIDEPKPYGKEQKLFRFFKFERK